VYGPLLGPLHDDVDPAAYFDGIAPRAEYWVEVESCGEGSQGGPGAAMDEIVCVCVVGNIGQCSGVFARYGLFGVYRDVRGFNEGANTV
jgi:hypothetical protein